MGGGQLPGGLRADLRGEATSLTAPIVSTPAAVAARTIDTRGAPAE
jgi:hypothetical protein